MSCNNQLLGIALVLIGIGGCSKPSADLAKASGLVTLDGVPVPEAKIMFHPVAGGARTSYGTTNEKGEYTTATAEYGVDFSACLRKDNFHAAQFHPEKSSDAGQKILENFIAL